MLKILHTADWHIGQTFFSYERTIEHKVFFEWLKEKLEELDVDILLIAGDVFDSPNPSAESQKLFNKFLRDATRHRKLQIIITAGNHDSGTRIEAAMPLLEDMQINIVGMMQKNADYEINYEKLIIPMHDKDGRIEGICLALPYLRHGDYPQARTYENGIELLLKDLLKISKEKYGRHLPVIVMGHMYLSGSLLSEDDRSERIIIGGLDSVDSSIFENSEIAYTALGHLHKSQCVGKNEKIRYSGAPLPMSFAEKNYKQGVNFIKIFSNKKVEIERIDFSPPIRLMSIPDKPMPLNEVLDILHKLPVGNIEPDSPYLEVKVLLDKPEPLYRQKIENILKDKAVRFTRAATISESSESSKKNQTPDDLKLLKPMQVAEDIFEKNYGRPMDDQMKKMLSQIIKDINL